MLAPLRRLSEFWQTHTKRYLHNTYLPLWSKGFKQNSPTSCHYSRVAKPQKNDVVYLKWMSIKAFQKTRLSSGFCKSYCSGKVCINLCSQLSSQNIQPAVGTSKTNVHAWPLQPQGLVRVLGTVLLKLGMLQSMHEGQPGWSCRSHLRLRPDSISRIVYVVTIPRPLIAVMKAIALPFLSTCL